MSGFTKQDIKNGAVVELRNGKRFLKVDNTLFGIKNNELVECHDSHLPLKMFEEDLTYSLSSEYDIVRVLNPYISLDCCHTALLDLRREDFSWAWERKEKRKVKLKDLTFEQYSNWKFQNCFKAHCKDCKFNRVNCWEETTVCWIKNKDLYSEEFLNQEVELEEVDNE